MTNINYRVVVECILKNKNNQVLLVRRSEDCEIAPDVRNVPAGKVKYNEVPKASAIRECKEETGLSVVVVREVGCRAFKSTKTKTDIETYRLAFSYLVSCPDNNYNIFLDSEHSEYRWVGQSEINNIEFDSLMPSLREIILKCFS